MATSSATNPIHQYQGLPATHVVTLYAYNEAGCVDSANYSVLVLQELLIYVPNTFTPNNDAANNSFKPVISAGIDPFNYQLLIFNRWGEVLFESYNPEVGWDGTCGGKIMQDGVYIWKITCGALQSEDIYEYTGHVNLLR